MLFQILKLYFLITVAKVALSTSDYRGKNIALGKNTYQSSVVEQGVSSNAVDGYRHPDYSEKSCVQTDNQFEPWWLLDLGENFYVTSVVITNRRDCCSERLHNFEIKVGDNNINGGMINARCTSIFQRRLKPGESREIICEEPLKGQFVSVIIPADYGVLNFCEVEVYGRRPTSVLSLKLISNGVAEAGASKNIYSQIVDNGNIHIFTEPGIYFKIYDIESGEDIGYDISNDTIRFLTWSRNDSESKMRNFLATSINPGTIVCMVVFFSCEKYYKATIPYLEQLVDQAITADLEYGESWALLGYKGIHNPVPHWRQMVRKKIGRGPSRIVQLVALRKAPSGPPSDVKIVYTDGYSIKITWSRPDDYLTDYDYHFNYSLCIGNLKTNFCVLVENDFKYTFTGLIPLNNYSITIRAQSGSMFGEAFNLTVSTIESDAKRINVEMTSRVEEDVSYRVYGRDYSSITVSGVTYDFNEHGHHFVVLDARTGNMTQRNSYNTFADSKSGAKISAFLSTLRDKVLIFMVVYHRAHVYYSDAASSLIAVCPHAPSVLTKGESNALICLKGMGAAPWMKSKISTYSSGPAVLETEILLPKDLLIHPTIKSIYPFATSFMVEWDSPKTDKFTGGISKYEICYTGAFGTGDCINIGANSLQWNVTELHPHVRYELKIRAAALLGYGPFSSIEYATTLEAAPSGPPYDLRVIFVNASSLTVSWSPPELILQNGVIRNYNVCVRIFAITSRCGDVVLPGSQTNYIASGLAPFTVYDVIVSAATSVGYGPSMLVTTKTSEAAPSGPPTDVRVVFVNSSSMTVTWSPPEKELQNGIILSYKVCVRNFRTKDKCEDIFSTEDQRRYTETNLIPYTVYDVIISAATSVGYGPSVMVSNRTSQAAPSGSPISFMVRSVSSTQLNLTWKEPNSEHHNGILTKYRLTLLPEPWSLTSKRTILLPRDRVSYLATDLSPYVIYVIEIRASTKEGFGPAAVLNVRTSMEVPSGPPTFVQVKNVTLTTFQVAWSPPAREKQNGAIISYFLCIREFGVLHACNDTRIVAGTQSQQLFTELSPDREYLVEIKAATKIGYGPSAFVQKMAGKCDSALLSDGNKIRNFQFSASGFLSDGHEAFQARFQNLQLWCEDGAKKGASIQVDVGGLIRIIAVATQGDISHFNARVTSYNIQYSKNGVNWTTVTVSGKEKIPGNSAAEIVKHYLDEPVLTRFIRFKVVTFSGPHQCMRIEIYGCAPAVTPDSLSVTSSNATSLNVAWQPSKTADKNGDIQGYVICARETSLVSCGKNKTSTDLTERTKWIEGLKPYTDYVIEVASFNVAGEGPPISIVHRTEQAAPSSGPEYIEILSTTTKSIRLFWSRVPEDARNGIIAAYSLCFQEYEQKHPCSSFQDVPSGSRNFILSDLLPFKEYLIFIRAATVAGWGPSASVRHWTLSAPPSGGPTRVFIKEIGPTALEVAWSPPEVEKRNGIIVSYRLCSKKVSDNSPCHNIVIVGGSEGQLPIAGLKPYTWYTVSVEASTIGGYGPPTVVRYRTGEWVPSDTPGDVSVTAFNDTSITLSWKSLDESKTNGVLTSYAIDVYEELDSGYLKMFSNVTVSNAVLSWTVGNLKEKTEYIIEVRAGTVMGFGPPSVVHQKTSGEADVKYVKKSNKAYIALAKAGIAAGALSFVGVVGFFVFISLLVTGYMPYTSPWRKRRREKWRKKVMRRNEEREMRSSDSEESYFNSSNSSERGSSDDDLDGRSSRKKAGRQKGSGRIDRTAKGTAGNKRGAKDDSYSESTYNPHHISVSLPNPEQGEIYGQVLLNAYAKSLMDMQSIYGGSTYCTRPVENIYGNRSVVNILPPGSIYGDNNLLPENIYGSPTASNFLPPENIYGNPSVSTINRPGDRQNSRGGMPEEIYGPNINTLSIHNYPGGVTSECLYGTQY